MSCDLTGRFQAPNPTRTTLEPPWGHPGTTGAIMITVRSFPNARVTKAPPVPPRHDRYDPGTTGTTLVLLVPLVPL